MFGDDHKLFCQVKVDFYGLPMEGIYGYDFMYNKFGFAPAAGALSSGDALRDTYSNHLVYETATGTVVLATLGPNELPSGQLELSSIIVSPAAPAGQSTRSPVIGPAGGYGAKGGIHVVFQELEPNQRWTLKGWSLEASTVVSQQDAGLQEPRPSALHGNARIDGGTRQWDPRIQSGGEGSPDPNPIETTIINPATYNCSSLENMKVANNFALLAGKNCGPGQDTKTFAVSMQDDNFVANYFPVLYQPFLVSEDSDSVNFTALNNWIAYKDGPDLVLTEVDRDKLQIIRPYFTPFDNNYTMPVPLSPWNLTATSFGSIDYAGSGLYQDYKVHLAENRTYRIYAISGGNCFAWHDATRITVTWPDGELTTRTNDTPDTTIPPNCAATDFTVGTRNTEVIVRVDRRDRGVEGLAPPLEYELFVEPL